MPVTIPNNAVDKADHPDLLGPLQTLLQGVNLLGKTTADKLPPGTTADNDPGAQVLESTASAIAKKAAPVVASLGGITAIGSAIGSFATSTDDSVRVAALGGAGAVLVAVILGFSYIVSTDLKSRTNGAIAMYEARKAITLQFLRESLSAAQADGSKSDPDTEDGAGKGTSGAKDAASADGTSPSQEGSPKPVTVSDVLVALAAAGARAQVLRTSDQRLGHLAGISCGDKIAVKWLDEVGEAQTSDPSELNVVSYTF
ncbi:MAG: hypothetical protein ACRDPY_08155 [Streptosporangiaceae bacterium]